MTWTRSIERQKYRMLLVIIVGSLVTQPFVRDYVLGRVLHEMMMALAMLSMFIIFPRKHERYWAILLAIPTTFGNLGKYILPDSMDMWRVVIYLLFSVGFLCFVVWVILRTLFEQRQVSMDHLIGAFCGYLLAGIAWSSMYLLVEECSPGAYDISPDIAWEMGNPDSRRSLFNYFSFTTLTTLGFGDVVPKHPLACSLAWLEAAFGQFYVAVMVSQLVGLKLEGQSQRERPPSEPFA